MEKTKKILIIDDSSTNVILLETILIQSGYIVVPAYSVKEALYFLAKETPDLIILDLLMPDVDGYEFLHIVKNDLTKKDIPIIVVSAVDDPDGIHKATSYGINEYVIKPIRPKQFTTLVDTLFKAK